VTLTIIAVIAFLAHVAIWVGLPDRSSSESTVTDLAVESI